MTGRDPDSRYPFLLGGGDLGALIRETNWAATPLGPVETWPQSLKTTLGIVLNSRYPMFVFWGPELIKIYNDGYRPITGHKHPWALGRPAREVWPEIWSDIKPLIDRALAGQPTWSDDLMLFMERNGFPEEVYFTFSYSPIPVETGGIGGMFCACTETTRKVLSERRLRTLHDLAAAPADARTVADACLLSADVLETNTADVPFSLIYLTMPDGTARLLGSSGIQQLDGFGPLTIGASDAGTWPVHLVAQERAARQVASLQAMFPATPDGPWPEKPSSAMVLPLVEKGLERGVGAIVLGISSRRPFDAEYREWFELVAGQISASLSNARAAEDERKRIEALAEIDRAKTVFFSNVSHEFRTPLTLLLGPLEDALGRPDATLAGPDLETSYRNALRLLRLVNTLLDFARIEAGRLDASFTPTDLAHVTADLASVFRSAIERAGLTLVVDCAPLPEPIFVDRDSWEKIVLNLLSNALKFTFAGTITVALQPVGNGVELTVADTGTGIAETELPRLFERFHRIEGARARTHEGSGIGLALVQELVRMHGGSIRAESTPGRGSRFIVSVKAGSAHLPQERVVSAPAATRSPNAGAATAFVDEAMRWLPQATTESIQPAGAASKHRVVVADDNADMRDYVVRLLAGTWRVEAVGDGAQALDALRREPADLLLTDVMMPVLDGFGLLRHVRADPVLQHLPVVMLSARAGEEARIGGLEAGADDYLFKPFSARELVARVSSQLQLADARAQAREAAELASRAKDEFLAILGHELRNPLAPILTALQLLRLRGVHSREHDVIARQVTHLTRLVDDLLDVSRITRGKIDLQTRPTDLEPVIVRAMELATPLLEQRQQLVDLDIARGGLVVDGDADRLAQVVANLLTNAAKYSDPGSRIVVRARRDGDEVELSVRDQGVGIAPEMLARVFEPFVQQTQTLERSRGGLGLGLTIVRSIVEKHGGRVSVQSDGPGRGSEFIVRLPAAVKPLPPQATTERRVERAGKTGTRVLLVDDNRDAAEMLQSALQRLGYTVAVAHDGPSALDLSAEFQPSVALLDIGLPVMDGYELAQSLREQHDALRLIAISGYGQEADRGRSAAAGFELHLVKPIALEQLYPILQDLDVSERPLS